MRNKILITIVVFGLMVIHSCSKDCEPSLAGCNDQPDEAGLCAAYFESWFFNKENNSCEKISYSGCSEIGFETKQACEECKCD
jgi:hypothetical protein